MAGKANDACDVSRLFDCIDELDRIHERHGISEDSTAAEASKALDELSKGMFDEIDAWGSESKRLLALAFAVREVGQILGGRIRALEAAAGIRSGALKSADSVVARVQARILEKRDEAPRR